MIVVDDVILQLIMELTPFLGIEGLLHLVIIGHFGTDLDLRPVTERGRPGFADFESQVLQSWDKYPDDELKIFAFAGGGDIPGHDQFNRFRHCHFDFGQIRGRKLWSLLGEMI